VSKVAPEAASILAAVQMRSRRFGAFIHSHLFRSKRLQGVITKPIRAEQSRPNPSSSFSKCSQPPWQAPHIHLTYRAVRARAAGALQKVRFWDPAHWRFRAEETRTVADQMTHEESRTIMRRIVNDYDRLGEEQLIQEATERKT
jgi:hypothetical protein